MPNIHSINFQFFEQKNKKEAAQQGQPLIEKYSGSNFKYLQSIFYYSHSIVTSLREPC